jgi:predicted DNA-binding transcriptional regulator YafY
MAKAENQKLKALYIAKYIMEYSDENHDFTATDIAQYLEEEHEITAERRSIYRDLDALKEVFSFDIESKQGGKYRLASRQFEFDDLRLLAECVDAAKFISAAKAKELVSMLSELCSIYQAEQLESETFVCNRAKTTQKGTLSIISTIRAAMAKKMDGQPHTPQKITFKYLKYNLNDVQTQVERRKGTTYKVSPYKLLINDGNYYLLAFDDHAQDMRTYRIDRMKDVKAIAEPREGVEAYSAIDMETYTQRVFSMYGGKQQRVSVRFINPLLDTAIERLGTGKDVFYRPEDEKHFVVTADVEISDQFYGWLCGFGKRVKIISPVTAAEDYKAYLDKIGSLY